MTSLVRKSAPKWKATAVVQGRIIDTNSEVYEGERIFNLTCHTNQITRPFPPTILLSSILFHCRQILRVDVLSVWLVSSRSVVWNLFLIFFFSSSFVCPTEILELNDAMPEFKKIDCEVLACSTDSHFSHHSWSAMLWLIVVVVTLRCQTSYYAYFPWPFNISLVNDFHPWHHGVTNYV